MTPDNPPRGSRFLSVVSFIWLGFVSAFAVIDHVALSHLQAKVAAPGPTATEWPLLQKRLAQLEENEVAHSRTLESLRTSNVSQQLDELNGRVATLQAAAAGVASKDEMGALSDRVSAMEGRLARARAAPSQASMPEVRVTAEKDPAPPFVILGAEWRGGERFLALASGEAQGLAAVHLLRVGDHESDWQLQGLEGNTAVFVRAGRVERLHVP